jgi:hypothetical protein
MATGATLTTRALRGDEARDRMRDGGATWKHRGSAGPRREVAATSGAPAETACLQRICHSRQQSAAPRALMVRKGSPVRVRQRASETALERGVLFIGVALVTTSRRKEGVAGSSPAEALPHRAAVARRLREHAQYGSSAPRSAGYPVGTGPSADGLSCLPDHVDGSVELLEQPRVDVPAQRSSVRTSRGNVTAQPKRILPSGAGPLAATNPVSPDSAKGPRLRAFCAPRLTRGDGDGDGGGCAGRAPTVRSRPRRPLK